MCLVLFETVITPAPDVIRLCSVVLFGSIGGSLQDIPDYGGTLQENMNRSRTRAIGLVSHGLSRVLPMAAIAVGAYITLSHLSIDKASPLSFCKSRKMSPTLAFSFLRFSVSHFAFFPSLSLSYLCSPELTVS